MTNLTDRGLSFSRAYKELQTVKTQLNEARSVVNQLEEQERKLTMEATRLQRELIEGAKAL